MGLRSDDDTQLLRPNGAPGDWEPAKDKRLTAWEAVHHLIRVLEAGGEGAAAKLAAALGTQAETARELAYRLYTVCERKSARPRRCRTTALCRAGPRSCGWRTRADSNGSLRAACSPQMMSNDERQEETAG